MTGVQQTGEHRPPTRLTVHTHGPAPSARPAAIRTAYPRGINRSTGGWSPPTEPPHAVMGAGELPVQLDHDSIRALVGAGGENDVVDDAVRAGALPVGGALAVGTGSFGAQALPPLAYEVEVLVLPQCRRDGMQHLFDQCGLGCQAAGERVDAVAGQSVACRAPAGRTQDFRCRARGLSPAWTAARAGGGQGAYDGGEQKGVVGGSGRRRRRGLRWWAGGGRGGCPGTGRRDR